jgi:hypothetical protein
MLKTGWLKDRAKLVTALFFVLLFCLGLWTSLDYGQPWDEPWEQDILRMNLNEYNAYLGFEDRFNLLSDIEKPDSLLISDSVERDHGESAYYPVFFLVTDGGISGKTRMILWHMYTWLWTMAGALALYGVTRRMRLSRTVSCAAVLFLMLSPRLFAQGHYNNKDIILLVSLLIMLWLMLRLIERPTVSRALPFALIGAVAANTKILGLFLFGLCAGGVFVCLLAGKRMNKRAWIAAGASLLGFCTFWFLLTPAMWRDPAAYVQYTFVNAFNFSRWSNYVLFRGTIYGYGHTALPFYYLPYMILVTTPLWLLVMIGIGQVYAARALLRGRREMLKDQTRLLLLLCTALWLGLVALTMVSRPVIYNGWRHFYFLTAPMLILAAYGLQRTWDALRGLKNRLYSHLFALVLAALMGITAVCMLTNHPYQYTYYNALLRADRQSNMELDYWNVSVLDTLDSLLDTTEGTVAITGADLWAQTGLRYAHALLPATERTRLIVLPENDPDAAFYLVNPTYARFSGWNAEGRELTVQTVSYGVSICEIYAARGGSDE